jgi:hypothetical protein
VRSISHGHRQALPDLLPDLNPLLSRVGMETACVHDVNYSVCAATHDLHLQPTDSVGQTHFALHTIMLTADGPWEATWPRSVPSFDRHRDQQYDGRRSQHLGRFSSSRWLVCSSTVSSTSSNIFGRRIESLENNWVVYGSHSPIHSAAALPIARSSCVFTLKPRVLFSLIMMVYSALPPVIPAMRCPKTSSWNTTSS